MCVCILKPNITVNIKVKEERDRLELILSSLQRELQYEKELNLETLEEIRSKTTQSDVQLLEIERLKDELASEVEEIGRLNGLLQDADDLRVVMKDVNEGINKKLIEVKARHESLKASLRSERVEKASIQHLFEESQAMLTSAQRQHDLLLREQADSYETKLTTMALALSSAQETVVKLQSQLTDYCELEAELVNVQDQLIEARELCDLFREQITEAVHKSREEEESRESLGSDLANLRANVTLLILQKEQSDAELCDLRNALAAERTKAEDLLFGRSQDADLIAELRYELTASELARADIECEVVELRNGRGEQLLLSKQLSDARETEVQAQEQHVVTLTAEADHVQEISRQHYEKQV